ncbi:MAG: DUF4159 domain-containing protein [Phycisphaerales bacterium]
MRHHCFVALRNRAIVLVAAVVSLYTGGLTLHAAEPDTTRIDAAFEQLINEARDLETIKNPEHRMVDSRPHRSVLTLSADDGPAVLERMAGKLAGDEYGDAYIRWHLMPCIKDWLHARAIGAADGTPVPLSSESVGALRDLFKDMPAEMPARYISPYNEEGQAINKRLASLRSQTRITVGTPPFDKTYSGRAALPHMTPAARKRAEPLVAEIERLEEQVKQMRDRDILLVNERYLDVSKAMREYRCDLTYAMIQSGDDKALDTVADAIAGLIRQHQRAGFDLTQAVYRAMRDGYLALYDDRALASLRARITRATAGARGYEKYNAGDEPLPYTVKPEMRSYAEYAAHLTDMLGDPGRVRAFSLQQTDAPAASAQPLSGPFDPETLSIEDIRAAIRTAIDELYSAAQQREGDAKLILPYEDIRHDSYYWWLNRYNQSKPIYQEVINETGNHALVCWAMLAAGESYQDPRLFRRISWVLASDTPYTYDRGMRLMMLSRLPAAMFTDAARRDTAWLEAAVTDEGNFNEEYFGGPSTGFGDHGSGLYGVLGLRGADRLGIDLNDRKTWAPIDKQWRITQQKAPEDQPAGWAIGIAQPDTGASSDSRKPRTKNTRSTVTGPMTAGGVATLTLTERYLTGPQLVEPGRDNVSPELRKGLRWLDENFDPKQSDGMDWYYYMWTVQRVGQASGRRTFNGVDWFRTVTAEMLNRQGYDGLWRDPTGNQGKLLSTGFALLYLANALEPVAVSKLRFDGAWDNRPNDLWNFAEYASGVYETDTTWQIVGLDQPVYELADSPLIYLATHEPFTLTDAEIDRLREYIEAGGMLVFNPEAPYNRMSDSVDALVAALFPGKSLEPVAEFHPFYSLHTQLNPNVPMQMVHNGVRPLMVVFNRDIGRGLQTNDTRRNIDSFVALSNLYLFAVGTESQRTRLQTNYITPPDRRPSERVSVARIQYDGEFDPEPGALSQLRAIMARDHDINLDIQTVTPDQLADQRIAFLTTSGSGSLTDDQAAALRAWVEAGGTLWLDAAGGTTDAVNAANAMLAKTFPGQFVTPLNEQSPIYTGQGLDSDAHDNRRVTYSRFAQRQMGQSSDPRLQAITIDGRAAVIYSPEDLTAAIAGCEHWGIFGYAPDSARQLAANGILAATR